jgi:subtilase family serine protease
MANLRTLPLYLLATAILFTTAATAQKITPAVRIVNQIDESQLVPLKGTVHPLANAANDRGAAPENLQLDRMHLVLKRSASQETALHQLLGELHSPGNANYHKWLTPDQFGAQFGPSDQDIATVTTWLTSHGFAVTKVNPGKLTLEFSGSAGQLRSAFHTQIHRYQVNGETHFANAGDPKIPAALAPVVGGFTSLNNFRAKPQSHYLGKATYDPRTDKATPQWTIGGGTAATDNFVLAPQDFAIQYDLNPLYSAGTNGTGQTIAIVNDSNINVAFANQFRTLFNLPANPPQIIIDGNDPGIDGVNNPDGPNYDSSEAYIDVEWAGAVAPGATIDLVVAADTALESGLLLAAEHAVYANVAPVISLSFGTCETYYQGYSVFFSTLWEQAAAQGITVMVSSGDAGSATCDNDNTQDYAVNGQAVNGFASTPYNVAVGGTDFYYSFYNQSAAAINTQLATYWNTTASNTNPAVSIKQVVPEQPWNDSQFGLNLFSYYTDTGGNDTTIAGGGGGSSGLFTPDNGYPKPGWQTGRGDLVRDLPDVSLFAANGYNDSYYPVCAVDADCQPVTTGSVQISGYGGTSVASPAFAGIMALVNQKYGRQGQANNVLYPLATQFPAAFHDITVGTNSVPCNITTVGGLDPVNCIAVSAPFNYTVTDSTYGTATEGQIGSGSTPWYNATAGYDEATGLGSVDASVLVGDWDKVTFAATSTSMTLAPSATTFTHGTSVTISGTVTGTGTPTGDVALMTDSTEPLQQGQGLAANLDLGQSTFPLTSGSYSSASIGYPLDTLPGGTYNIWTHYGGDANNAPSDSPKTQITVSKELSTTWLTVLDVSGGEPISSGTTAIPYGTQLILDADALPTTYYNQCINVSTVPGSCSSFYYTYPTGTVTFADNGNTVNTAVINAEGDAEYNAPWSVGSHSIAVNYSGDQSYSKSTGAPVSPYTFTVVPDQPDIFVGSPIQNSDGSVGAGRPTVFTIAVENTANLSSEQNNNIPFSAAAKAPTGTITVSGLPSGSTTSATLTAAVDPSTYFPEGVGTITIPASAATGTYHLTINYVSGDSNYASVSGATGTVSVTAATGIASTTAVTSTTGSISPTTNITVSGTVTGQGTKAPTGSVQFYSSGYTLGYGSITPGTTGDVSTFTAVLNSQNLFQGSNVITVQYLGDSVYAPSSATLSNPVSNPLSDFSLVPSAVIVPVTAGSSATDTINLASLNGFSGTVNLTCAPSPGVTCTIPSQGLSSGGSASSTLTIFAQTDTADQSYNVLITGTDPTGQFVHTLTVQAVVTGSPAGTSSFALTNGGNITIPTLGATTGNSASVTVTPLGGFTGAVALTCAVTPTSGTIPTCSLAPASVSLTGSAASISTLSVGTTTSTTPGTYTVTVTGTSGAFTLTTQVIVNVGTPGFAMTNNGPITIATTGTPGTATITLTPSDGFTGTVNLSCTVASPSGANDPATCSIPSTATITSGATTATLTLTTTAATSLNKPFKLFWPSAGGAALALLCFFIVPRRRNWLAVIGLLALFVSGAVIGCGGGGGGKGGGGSSNPGTTTGTYTVTVTGTSGSLTQTTVVTFNIQ